MELPIHDFVQRLFLHVPQPGHKIVRSYGIYAGSRQADLLRSRDLLGQPPIPEPGLRPWQDCVAMVGEQHPERCPICGARLITRGIVRPEPRSRPWKLPPLREAA
jgi:hypothetical protein